MGVDWQLKGLGDRLWDHPLSGGNRVIKDVCKNAIQERQNKGMVGGVDNSCGSPDNCFY